MSEKQTKPKSAAKTKKPPKVRAPAAGEKRPVGRPSLYTPELAAEICEAISVSDKGLYHICAANPKFPSEETFRLWIVRDPELFGRYMRVKELQQLWMAERAQRIADDGANDTYIDDDGKVKVDTDVIQRSRLRVDTIKWQASKLAPKMFGEKVDVNHGGQADNPLEVLFNQVSGTPFKPK
jgi:hypothetical protein